MAFKQQHKCQPAALVVSKMGGVCQLARKLGGTPGMVTRWIAPADEGGTGGRIPSKHHKRILEIAKAEKIPVTAADIIGA